MNEIVTAELFRAAFAIAGAASAGMIGYNIYKSDEFDRSETSVAATTSLVSYVCLLIAGLGFYATTKELEWQRNDDPKTAVCVDMKCDGKTKDVSHQLYFDTDNNPKTIEYTGQVENTPTNNAQLKKQDVKIGKSMNIAQWRQFVRMERVQ